MGSVRGGSVCSVDIKLEPSYLSTRCLFTACPAGLHLSVSPQPGPPHHFNLLTSSAICTGSHSPLDMTVCTDVPCACNDSAAWDGIGAGASGHGRHKRETDSLELRCCRFARKHRAEMSIPGVYLNGAAFRTLFDQPRRALLRPSLDSQFSWEGLRERQKRRQERRQSVVKNVVKNVRRNKSSPVTLGHPSGGRV